MNKVKKFKLTNNNDNSFETDNWRNHRDKGGLGLKERNLEYTVNNLADQVGNLFEAVVPQAFKNMTCRGGQAEKCRIGDSRKSGNERPFSGVTAVSDFCAHAHRGLCLHSKISFCLALIKFQCDILSHGGVRLSTLSIERAISEFLPDIHSEFMRERAVGKE